MVETPQINSVNTEERESIQQCLEICAEVSHHIEKLQKDSVLSHSELSRPHTHETDLYAAQARRITSQRLNSCHTEMQLTSAELQSRLADVDSRLASLSQKPWSKEGPATSCSDVDTVQKELDSIRQCLSICQEATEQSANARVNVFEDVTMADDGKQIIVSTIGDLIAAKRIKAGARSVQLLGQMSDASVQQCSQPLSSATNVGSMHTRAGPDSAVKAEKPSTAQFTGRYGRGQTLAS